MPAADSVDPAVHHLDNAIGSREAKYLLQTGRKCHIQMVGKRCRQLPNDKDEETAVWLVLPKRPASIPASHDRLAVRCHCRLEHGGQPKVRIVNAAAVGQSASQTLLPMASRRTNPSTSGRPPSGNLEAGPGPYCVGSFGRWNSSLSRSCIFSFRRLGLRRFDEEGDSGRRCCRQAMSLFVRSVPRPLRLCRGVSEARACIHGDGRRSINVEGPRRTIERMTWRRKEMEAGIDVSKDVLDVAVRRDVRAARDRALRQCAGPSEATRCVSSTALRCRAGCRTPLPARPGVSCWSR